MKKGTIVVAVVLTVLGAALIFAALAVSGVDLSKLSAVTYVTNTYTAEGEFDKIEIDTKTADVILKKSEDGKLSVVCVESDKVTNSVTVEDGTLKIGCKDGRNWVDYVSFYVKPLSVTVYLPGDEYDALTVDTPTGSVTVPSGFSLGEAEITVGTGRVSFDAAVSGSVKIKSATGSVGTKDVPAKRIEITVSTGSVTMDGGRVSDSMKITASTGSVTLKNTTADGSLEIETTTGSVRFEDCDAGSIYVKASTGSVSGTLLTEKDLHASATTGSVSVPDSRSAGYT